MRRRAAAVLAALLVAFAGGCGGGERQSHRGAARQHLLRQGARVFADDCQTCHPLLGRPNLEVHGDWPPGLDLDQVKVEPAYAAERLSSGGVAMGGFTGTSQEGRAVLAYVLSVGGRETGLPPGSTSDKLARGRAVYDHNCQRCHAIEGRKPTRPNPTWEATDFDRVRPGVLWVERIVREGLRIAMPSFRHRLTYGQMRAVALYVNATAFGGPAARRRR